jgi:transmembrane sensor
VQQPPENFQNPVEASAAQWLARRDRGLTAAEQDAYLQWLSQIPAHGSALARLEKTWRSLDQLSTWRPAHSSRPNPDLLAPRRKRSWRWHGLLAAAAAIAIASILIWPLGESRSLRHQAIIHPGPEKMVLEDGSLIELNAGARVDVKFTPEERRVLLVHGEAHFSVAKNPARPFIVSADKFAVRAVGTAFSVALDREAVSVLVTEGKVRLDQTPVVSEDQLPVASPHELSSLVAGQKAIIEIATQTLTDALRESPALHISEVTPAEIERALAWQGLRLEFIDMPLGDVVAEFNRYNLRKLTIADAETAAIVVGGNFRADKVDSFVRLLDSGFGVSARPDGNQIVLSRTR